VPSLLGAFLAISLTLVGSTGNIPVVSHPGFLPLSAATQLQKSLKCEEVYQVISDPYRAARMNGFYCVTGLRANFRLVKIFDSTKAAKEDTDLYEPIQTGGRRLYLGKNWFVFGLPQDINAVVASSFMQKTDAGLGLTDYTTKQDLCMGLSTAAMESHFDDLTGEKRHFQDLEWLFKGGTKQVRAAIQRYGAQLKKSLLGKNAFPMEQDLAQASLTYRPFCLSQKGQHFKQTRP
jgi:hypothetical protein